MTILSDRPFTPFSFQPSGFSIPFRTYSPESIQLTTDD
jgi:hypothetical protein